MNIELFPPSLRLKDEMEDYLHHEGLGNVIPASRRRIRRPTPLTGPWFLAVPLLSIAVTYTYTGCGQQLIWALVAPLAFYGFVTLLFVLVGQARNQQSEVAKTLVGCSLLIGLPLLLSAVVGFIANTRTAALTYFLAIVFVTILSATLPLHLLFGAIRSVVAGIKHSLALLPNLLLVTIAVILLSFFSQELWQGLGRISAQRILLSFLWLTPPMLLLLRTTVSEYVDRITQQPLKVSDAISATGQVSVTRARQRVSFDSHPEWNEISARFSSSEVLEVPSDVHATVRRQVGNWMLTVLLINVLILSLVYFSYLFGLLALLLDPELLARWTEIPLDSMKMVVGVCGLAQPLLLRTTDIAIGKVSLFLGTFLAATSTINIMQDESLRTQLTGWLRDKGASWLAASTVYRSSFRD